MKKSYLLIIATIMLAFCLFACGNNDTSNSTSSIDSITDFSTDSSSDNSTDSSNTENSTDTPTNSDTESSSDTLEDSNTDPSNNGRLEFGDLHKVNNLKCEITFVKTDEVINFDQEKALEIYDIIMKYDYTELSVSELREWLFSDTKGNYIYIYFTGDAYSEEFPLGDYGSYNIYDSDIMYGSLSPFISFSSGYQFEKGLYDQLCQYIAENR